MDEPTGFDKIAGSDFGHRASDGPPQAGEAQDGPSNPTLFATFPAWPGAEKSLILRSIPELGTRNAGEAI